MQHHEIPGAQAQPIDKLLAPFRRFFAIEASSGILLMATTVLALVWANSGLADSYHALWANKVTIGFGDYALSKALILWINDGLMAIFFFVVGLEIKREILAGELASPRQAALPIAAAIGGMVVPASIYLMFNGGTAAASGWGVPMATDIAFALGILSLLGDRVPLSLKVFLTAVAIVDDLGAVLVIALFYTADLSFSFLMLGAAAFAVMLLLNWLGVRRITPYLLVGIVLWFALLKSGVHATIAGVLGAMAIPARAALAPQALRGTARQALSVFENALQGDKPVLACDDKQHAIHHVEMIAEKAGTPLQRLEHALHPWVAWFIMPVFALANAGVTVSGEMVSMLFEPLSLGIFFGLLLGKQGGVTLAVWLLVKTGIAKLPKGIGIGMFYAIGWLAGIGFTMAIFIATLAFENPAHVEAAKMSILCASFVAGLGGYLLMKVLLRGRESSES
ncbi:Na+/H+ antiporter NhaA [Oleidesulfovibrio sp.]|uniref:Na+/H+ antiporter NhaA n=1 Tax=Oleidesulfovibrio sp. TaxID=2909707 RepID=UPI003A885113